jgi:hypothetical protein
MAFFFLAIQFLSDNWKHGFSVRELYFLLSNIENMEVEPLIIAQFKLVFDTQIYV